jgi:hypothetical protein
MKIVITNNPLVLKDGDYNTIFLENKDYLDVLIQVRDLVQENYRLLTHPLSSNFLADKTIYKTVVLEDGKTLDLQSVELIENAIILSRNSLLYRDERIFEPKIMDDLQFVDFEIIKQAL